MRQQLSLHCLTAALCICCVMLHCSELGKYIGVLAGLGRECLTQIQYLTLQRLDGALRLCHCCY